MGQGKPISQDKLRSGLNSLVEVFEKEKIEEEYFTKTDSPDTAAADSGNKFRKIGTIASAFSLLAVGAGLSYYFAKKR